MSPADAAEQRPGRIAALDVARGLFLIVSVTQVSILAPRPDALRHADWFGIAFIDWIFPLFVVLSGTGLAFAYKNRVPARVTARRVIVLLICGLLYNALTMPGGVDLSTFWVTGPLQLYAGLVLAIALLSPLLRVRPTAWVGFTVVLSIGWTAFLWLWQRGCGGELSRECNPSGVVDAAVFGIHMYARGELGHDPVGIVALVGALITASAGVVAGLVFLRLRQSRMLGVWLAGWAGALGALGWALSQFVPAFKRLWTPGFGLLTAMLGVALLGLCFLLVDSPRSPRAAGITAIVSAPFVALGRNSLLVYFGSHLIVYLMVQSPSGRDGQSLAHAVAERVAIGGSAQLGFALVSLAAWWVLALVLHRLRVYVHA